MNNYPPGVTGNEYAIGGPEAEWQEQRECPLCGASGMFIHERHYEFGVRAFCNNPDCNAHIDGFTVDPEDEEPDLEPAGDGGGSDESPN